MLAEMFLLRLRTMVRKQAYGMATPTSASDRRLFPSRCRVEPVAGTSRQRRPGWVERSAPGLR